MKRFDLALGAFCLCATASLAWADPCFQLAPTSSCGEFQESSQVFNCGLITNHPVWIITPGDVYTCTTNFEGNGYTECQNNAGLHAHSVRTTYWCDDGVLKWSTEIWQQCQSGALDGTGCQGSGGFPGSGG